MTGIPKITPCVQSTVLFVILGLSIIAAMIGISTSANERTNENLSFTVKTDRIVYDVTQQVITIRIVMTCCVTS